MTRPPRDTADPDPTRQGRRLYPVPGPGDTTPEHDTAPDPDDATDSGDGFEADADDGPIPWGNTSEELLDEALQQLQVLTERIGKLDELINADRHDQAGTGAGKHLRYRYERHPPGDAAAAHAELSRWVSWLVATYQLTDTVPPCWDRHDALAEELAGFYVAWQNVWADEGRYDAAVLWHDQLHRAAANRWPMWLRGARCSQTCALDTDFAQQTHHRWAEQAAAGGGADHRLTRTRELALPIPPPTKKTPPKKKAPQKGTTPPGGPTGKPTPAPSHRFVLVRGTRQPWAES
ncbi:hypothetical protein ACVBEQ_27560, partial [Nakamurella sp. GG22]